MRHKWFGVTNHNAIAVRLKSSDHISIQLPTDEIIENGLRSHLAALGCPLPAIVFHHQKAERLVSLWDRMTKQLAFGGSNTAYAVSITVGPPALTWSYR
jgi:hypothetical protein